MVLPVSFNFETNVFSSCTVWVKVGCGAYDLSPVFADEVGSRFWIYGWLTELLDSAEAATCAKPGVPWDLNFCYVSLQ